MAEIKIPIEISDETLQKIAETVVAEMRKDPNADWVDVVRCRDCKHSKDGVGGRLKCNWHNWWQNPDFYCGYGERSEEP